MTSSLVTQSGGEEFTYIGDLKK